jgi:hypothetical protein
MLLAVSIAVWEWDCTITVLVKLPWHKQLVAHNKITFFINMSYAPDAPKRKELPGQEMDSMFQSS